MKKGEEERLNEFIRQTERNRRANQEMHAEQLREPGPRKASEWHRLEEERAKAQATQDEKERNMKRVVWPGKIPEETLEVMRTEMAVFKGDLLAVESESHFHWDPNQFKVKRISETEGILTLERRGEAT